MITNEMKNIEKYAEEYNVPIMEKKGLLFLLNQIEKNNVKNILEIGTAIGYTAINMALVDSNIKVTSIERDSIRYFEALKNIKLFKLEKRIELVLADALDIELEDKYDLIFIDAAKGQYIKFFEKYSKNLKEDGIIVSDNISFHGLVDTEDVIPSKNLRQLVKKIRDYIIYLKDRKDFETKFYKVGDGISVSRRIK